MADAPAANVLQYNNIVLHHVPNEQAPGLLAAMLVFSFCLGAIVLDLTTNLLYDISLLTRTGWREPVKATNRVAYLLCRYAAFVFLTMTIIYMNLPGSDCRVYARAVNVMWVVPLISVDLIFVQRTLAVYGWPKGLAVLLGFIYISYVGLCTYSVVEFGYGYRIPGTDFCAYQTNSTHIKPHSILFILYITLVILLDTLILVLTTHRLVEGGLTNLPHLLLTKSNDLRRAKDARKAAGHDVGEVSLSGLLLRQGVGYFVLLEGSRLVFLIVYYVLDNETSYQVLVSGILATVGPLMGGMLFRQTSEAVKRAAYVSKSGGEFSQARSHPSSSAAVTPSAFSAHIPLSPRSRNEQGHFNALPLTMPPTPLTTKENGSDGDSVNTGQLHGDEADEAGLRIFVEQKTDVEMSPMQQEASHAASRHLPTHHRSHNNAPRAYDEEEGLPIHQRYVRRPTSVVALDANVGQGDRTTPASNGHYFEGETAFTPVLPTTRVSNGIGHHHQQSGSAR